MLSVYVTEPDMISVDNAKKLLPVEKYKLVAGTVAMDDEAAATAEVLLIRSGTTVDAATLGRLTSLRAVVRVGVGLDKVDVGACKAAGVAVYNAPGANAEAVAEYVAAMALYAGRRLYRLDRQRVEGWQRSDFAGSAISGKTIGIVGFGNIGKLVRHKLAGLGAVEFLAYDPYLSEAQVAEHGATLAALDELLSAADIISLHLPLTAETNHLINADGLALLKPQAILVNASRGGIVSEQAVIGARLAGADFTYIADVVENEPHVNPQLLEDEQIIVTPHMGSLTDASEAAMLRLAIENFLAGKKV